MVSITIRGVPNEIHNALTLWASRRGTSLQQSLLMELQQGDGEPGIDEFLAEVRDELAKSGAELSVDEILAALEADRR